MEAKACHVLIVYNIKGNQQSHHPLLPLFSLFARGLDRKTGSVHFEIGACMRIYYITYSYQFNQDVSWRFIRIFKLILLCRYPHFPIYLNFSQNIIKLIKNPVSLQISKCTSYTFPFYKVPHLCR